MMWKNILGEKKKVFVICFLNHCESELSGTVPTFILHGEMTLGTRGRGRPSCLTEPQNHDILGLEEILKVPGTTACILKDAGK